MQTLADALRDQLRENYGVCGGLAEETGPAFRRFETRRVEHEFLCFCVVCRSGLHALHV